MGKLSRTWQMMRASWWVLKQDKELVFFPILSGIATLLVIASFGLPLLATMPAGEGSGEENPFLLIVAFLFYFVTYFIVIFFNAAIIACAMERMDGGDPTVGFGLRAAWRRLPQIFGWALVTATVGFILRMIEERVGIVGRIVVAILGMAWTVTAFLVVPVLVMEGKGPIQAYKDSVAMLRRSWGEQLAGNVSFALIFGLLSLPAVLLFMGGFATGSGTLALIIAAACGLYLVALGLIQSTLQAIYQAAVYRYASTGHAPEGFDDRLMADSFRAR